MIGNGEFINLEPYTVKTWKVKKRNRRIAALSLIVALVVGIVCSFIYSRKAIIDGEKQIDCVICHNRHSALTAYFTRKGSPTPQMMASAVLATHRPRLMAAIAVRESGGDPKAVGDGGKSKGAFQVQSRHWKQVLHEKRVSKDPTIQALDSERILEELIVASNGNLNKALNRYNGDTRKKKYARNILAELSEVP